MTAVPTDFLARIDVIIAKSHCLDLATLNEANTKALLIEPVLSALGWDVLDLDSVTREYKVYDGTFLDYALLVGAKALLFCEAKPTGKHLDDSKWVSQTINYANNEGVVWCVLTDGLHWRVFKANEAVSMHKKLAFELNIEDLIDPVRRPEALRLFACLTPAAVAEGDLSTLGTQIFVDGQVREALGSLVEEPSKRFLDALRAAIGTDVSLTPAELRAALSRVAKAITDALATPPPTNGVPVQLRTPPQPAAPSVATLSPSAQADKQVGREPSYAQRLSNWPAAAALDASLREALRVSGGLVLTERRLYWTIRRGRVLIGAFELRRSHLKLRLSADVATLTAAVPAAADKLTDISKVGHWAPGQASFDITTADDDLVMAVALLAAVPGEQAAK